MGALQLTRCTVSSNVAWGANGRGGGVFVHGASLHVKDTVFADNYASSAGGAVLLGPLGAHSLKVTRSNFTGNAARQYGGRGAGVRLPSCSWGQARKIDGCSNCSYPVFTFSNPQRSNCSICPANSRNCSGTTLLPDTGYWQSGPLSAHMIKCPRRAACRRDATADKRLACLQQQQLMLNNPGYSDDIGADIKGRRGGRALTPWDVLREECRPILQQLAAGSMQPGSGPGHALPALIDKVLLGSNRHLLQGTAPLTQYLAFNSSEAIADAYATIMCAEGYQGRLCAHCLFPGTQQSGAWGSTFSGSCGRCPSRSVAASAYALSRLFDFAMVGLLIITTLVEMKKRRAEVVKARQVMLAKMAGKGGRASGGAAGATPAAASGEGAGGGVSRPGGGPLEAPGGLSAGPFGESSTPGMMPPMREEEVGPYAARLMDRGDPAAGAAAAGEQGQGRPFHPSFTFRPTLQHHEQSASFTFGEGAQQQPQMGRHMQQELQLMQQQQQQQQQHVAPGYGECSDSASVTSSMQHSQVALLHERVPPAARPPPQQPQPQPAAAGRATAGRPPREFIPKANESSAHGAASDGRAPGQPPMERIPGSGAAGYNGPTETPTPDYIATHAPVIVDPSVPQLHYQKPLQRVPLFVREVAGGSGGRKHTVASYTPASLQLGELFEVLKDFLQVLGILQTVLLSWQTAAAAATAATAAISGVNVTPMSTKAWISLDCLLPRTLDVARQLQLYHIAAQLLLPVCYALIVLAIFLAYAGYVSLRTRQPLWRGVLGVRLQAPIISSCLVMLSYFYPSVAYTVLGVFRCRYLDPSSGSSSISVEGEVLRAPGWYWALDLERQCFVDGEHRALALGLGIPGALLLLAYPLAQALVLARRVAAGQVTGTSEFFARYGHLVEDFRPRLFFWASIVELRKLLLVAVVLGFESTGVLSQLMACGALLLGYCAALMGLLPYPYRLLNRLHLAAGGVLLAVVWINLYIATDGDAGDALSAAALGRRSLGLQLLSVVLVLAMVALLLLMFSCRPCC
eukprot:jgi/Sobl393_1/14475/SZX77538.1